MNRCVITSALSLFCVAGIAQADVKLPAIFSDHMVLQRGQKVPVWGTADAGEQVTVTLGDAKATATAGQDGKWSAALNSLKASDQPADVTVAGKNTVTIKDVLVGDVWVASGQSNMEFALGASHSAKEEIPKANAPTIRLFIVGKKIAFDPQTDCVGHWDVCTPATAPRFSAVGYFFARDIQDDQKVPIGMIGTYWGGTPAQAWTSLEALAAHPETKGLADAFKTTQSTIAALKENYEKKTVPEWDAAHKKWQDEIGTPYAEELKKWTAAVAEAKKAGSPEPKKPALSKPEPKKPGAPDGNPNLATVLTNGMIAPIVPYAIKGAIWYQGESNASTAVQYQTLFPAMITDWRTRWNQGDFPFIWVQLASFQARLPEPTQASSAWPGLREAQSMTLKLPNTGQAVIIDIGEAETIHPLDKQDVGHRVAIAAKHVAYGEELVYSGPTYDAMKVDGDKIRVTFKNIGSGLEIGAAPPIRLGTPQAAPASELKGFSIAGEDKKFVWATATIDGDSVVVSSPAVKNPTAVRYAWAVNPECNLYNKEKLPASPFRTDTWGDPAPAPKAAK